MITSPSCKKIILSLFLLLTSPLITEQCSAAKPSASQQNIKPPNIILFLADDLGYAELGCYGQKIIKTPHIDQLAKEGMKFTNFYSGNAVCAPCRCNLMTGKHPGNAYIRSNSKPENLQHLKAKFGWEFPGQTPIPDSEVTIAEVLKQKNYATAACGKWGLGHVGTTGDPNKQGFDLFYGFNDQVHAHNHYPRFLWRNNKKEILPGNDRTLYGKTYSQDKFTEVGLQFIRDNKEKPFFLYMPFAVPHLSLQVTEESLKQYKGKIKETEYKHHGYLKHPYPHAAYAAMISHMDRDIGKFMALLKELKLDDNTIVIFTSDNGPTYDRLGGSDSEFFQSAGPFRGLKGSLYEGGIRVPMIARFPGKISPDSTSDQVAAIWDFMPTFAELTGTKNPKNIDGISLLPTLFGKANQQQKREFLYWEFPSYGGQQVVRMGDWKGVRQELNGVRSRKRGSKKIPRRKDPLRIELYNLKTDIGEKNDVAKDHPKLVEKMRKIMQQEHTPSQLFPLKALDEK